MKDIFKNNMELYSKLFHRVSTYWKNYANMLEAFSNTHNLSQRDAKDKAGSFPANGHDIYNYVARYTMSNLQIQAILKFDGVLDFDKLKRAVNLSIEAEPVFGCRFVESDPPYWKPLDNISMINFCTMEETTDMDQAIEKFIQSSIDIDTDPMLNVKLIRSESCDVLAMKICHACCDGAGVQEYIQLLADIYSHIDRENGTYIPEPRIAGRKDQDRLFKELGINNPDSLFIPGSDISIPMWPFPWEQGGSNTACMSVLRIPREYMESMIRHAKSKGATMNDLILTAYYRAMLKVKQPVYGIPMEIPITVNLRRYLPDQKTEAIRNFSGSVNTRLVMLINETFDETLQRVSNMMKQNKKRYPGLQSAIGLERIEKISFHETLAYYQAPLDTGKAKNFCPLYCGDTCVPTLSNLGYMSKSLIQFGSHTAHDAYILPPVVRAPGILLMASTYNSVLTLAIGYYKYTVSKEIIEGLLNNIRDDLVEGCKDPQEASGETE